jgi:hypothetical protein
MDLTYAPDDQIGELLGHHTRPFGSEGIHKLIHTIQDAGILIFKVMNI